MATLKSTISSAFLVAFCTVIFAGGLFAWHNRADIAGAIWLYQEGWTLQEIINNGEPTDSVDQ